MRSDETSRSVTLVYFAWVRERIGVERETLDLPADVETGADLIAFLKARGAHYEAALADELAIRMAIDMELADFGRQLGDAREIALFPPMTGG